MMVKVIYIATARLHQSLSVGRRKMETQEQKLMLFPLKPEMPELAQRGLGRFSDLLKKAVSYSKQTTLQLSNTIFEVKT